MSIKRCLVTITTPIVLDVESDDPSKFELQMAFHRAYGSIEGMVACEDIDGECFMTLEVVK